MKLTPETYVVGGGRSGFGISGTLDSHVYLINGGSEMALIDVGLGMPGSFDKILQNIRDDGLEPRKIRKIILTHYHADHVGAAFEAYQCLDAEVIASEITAEAVRAGDEKASSIEVARAMGFYPADYRFAACPVAQTVREGEFIRVGDLTLQTWETPGHADGHLSFWMQGSDRSYLIGADLVFWGGKVLLQSIHDCRPDAYARSVEKMMTLEFDALLPGHLQISLSEGKRHVESAAAIFRNLRVPPNLT